MDQQRLKDSVQTSGSAVKRINPYRRFLGCHIPNWLLSMSVSPMAKLVYGKLAQYAGEHGVAWPSSERLAKDLGVTGRHVRRTIAELRDHGLIEVIDRSAEGKAPLIYFLEHPEMGAGPDPLTPEEASAVERATAETPTAAQGGVPKVSPPPGQNGPGGVDRSVHPPGQIRPGTPYLVRESGREPALACARGASPPPPVIETWDALVVRATGRHYVPSGRDAKAVESMLDSARTLARTEAREQPGASVEALTAQILDHWLGSLAQHEFCQRRNYGLWTGPVVLTDLGSPFVRRQKHAPQPEPDEDDGPELSPDEIAQRWDSIRSIMAGVGSTP